MNTIRTLVVAAGLLMAVNSFADNPTELEAVKQAAFETCLTHAQEKYGSAEIVSKPRKRKISRTKGYGFKMRVGDKNQRMNCLASDSGATMFYSGSL